MVMAAPIVSIGKVSELSSYENSASEDDASLLSLNDYEVSWSSTRKKRAAVASMKNNNDEPKTKKVRASSSSKQQYPIGTVISKAFVVPGQNTMRRFRGEVKEYYSDVHEYRIEYEDGDAEDLTESDVTKYLVAVAAQKPKSNNTNMQGTSNVSDDRKKSAQIIVTKDNADSVKVERLAIGDIVYSAYSDAKTKKKSRKDTMFCRGTVEALKETRWSLTYDVLFNNDKYVASIDRSLVIPEHRYLYENLKQGLDVGQRVVAGWWEDALDTSSPPSGWYSGYIKACRQQKQGGKFGPNRFYDIIFDDGDVLDDIEDIFVFEESEYKLLSRGVRGASAWKGAKNVLDLDSTDRWAATVGYWELEDNNDGEKRAFPFLGDALRWYDDHIVSCKGANTKKADLNLPEEWTIDSDGKCPPYRSIGIDIDTGRPRATPFFLKEPNGLAVNDDVKKRVSRSNALVRTAPFKNIGEEDKAKESASCPLSDTPKQRTEEAVSRPRRISMSMSPFYGVPLESAEHRSIRVVEYVPPAMPRHEQNRDTLNSSEECNESSACNNIVKSGIRRGENVYAVYRGASASTAAKTEWLPGRVWDVKVKHESPNGPVKTYDIIFNNGQVEQKLDEVWVMKKEDYEVSCLG